MKNKILSFLFAVFLICSLALNVSADHPVPDMTDNGSITFIMKYGNELLDDGYLNLYRVGDIADDDGDYYFAPVEKLKRRFGDKLDVSDRDLPEELVTYSKVIGLPVISVAIERGSASFVDLSPGLFVVWQDEKDATDGFTPIQPFLISIPRYKNGEYITDIICYPKVPPETEPTTPPPCTTPPPPPPPPGTPPPRVPQTGQLNWPVPVMAVSGCILFVLGLVLTSGRKETDDEA